MIKRIWFDIVFGFVSLVMKDSCARKLSEMK